MSIGAPRLRQLGVSVQHPIPTLNIGSTRDSMTSTETRAPASTRSFAVSSASSGRRRVSAQMREPADAARIQQFMRALGAAAPREGTCYLVGGGTAVLLGWRETTIDVDIELDPEQDELLRALPAIKDELQINVELASPLHFIPVPAGWEERSPSVGRDGRLTFKHFDLYSRHWPARAWPQPGSRGCARDARARSGGPLRSAFEEIEPQLYRFPRSTPATTGTDSKTSSASSRPAADPFLAAFVELLLPERDALLQLVDDVAAG